MTVADLVVSTATADDVPGIARVQSAAAAALTARYGQGHWSLPTTENAVRRRIRESLVIVGRLGADVVATLTLQKKKPWAIDRSLLTPVARRLYLVAMAVAPECQRQGMGTRLVGEAERMARAEGVHAIALDAYDAPAGGGGFYTQCGYQEIGRKNTERCRSCTSNECSS